MKKCLISLVIVHGLLIFSTQIFSLEEKTGPGALTERVGEHIRMLISSSSGLSEFTPNGEHLYASSMLKHFYERRNFYPVWSGDEGLFNHAESLVNAIGEVNSHGLVPEYYHLERIKSVIDQGQRQKMMSPLHKPEVLAELDLLLTDAFLMLGCHFSAGCENPVMSEIEWFANRVDLDVDIMLEDALKENSIRETLNKLLPSQPGYSELRQTLIHYRGILANGGWPTVNNNAVLKKGLENSEVAELKKRLVVSGDLEYSDKGETRFFDEDLENAVKRFQKRHGLIPDGMVGPFTRKFLNVPVQARVRQIEVNLERMRWISRNLGHRYILVNIADFRMDVIEHGRKQMSMAVVVGKPYRYTPIFSETVTFIVLNPSWNIPFSISKDEILPKIKDDPDYLEKQNIKILTSWTNKGEEIAPEAINWPDMNADNLTLKFNQGPGPLNPLGRIKFVFPNRFGVYMHDTPARELFFESVRTFSHGCIRIEKPVDLAEYLLQGYLGWTREKILAAIKEDKEKWIRLPQPVSIHILYLTAWVDKEGVLQFRDDVYGRDERLARVLRRAPPDSPPTEKLFKTF